MQHMYSAEIYTTYNSKISSMYFKYIMIEKKQGSANYTFKIYDFIAIIFLIIYIFYDTQN